jgi:hypothetical protein
MQFADLEFEKHPRDGWAGNIEWAFAPFPNGWGVSVLRGMSAYNMYGLDYETCRFHDPHANLPDYDSIRRQGTTEDVQREMDAVSALPKSDRSGQGV